MGPSGSGKTTLLNLLGGIDRADGGEVRIAGSRIDGMSEGQLARWRAANIGFIFQFYNLMPMLTAAQNVELPLLLTNLRKQGARGARPDRAVGGRPRRSRQALSARNVGRPAAARRHRARHRVRSEPAAVRRADRRPRPHSADEILSILQLLNKELGKTIVMVTHDPAAARYAQRTLHLDKGHFVERELAA